MILLLHRCNPGTIQADSAEAEDSTEGAADDDEEEEEDNDNDDD